MKTLFFDIFKNLKLIFSGYNLFWHLLAISLTFIIVISGFDWLYFQSTRGFIIGLFLFPAVIIGGLLPIIGPLALLLIGAIRKNLRLINTAWATGQAALVGWLVSSTYKAFTGRTPPAFRSLGNLGDISHGFRFGVFRGGIFAGWPSSHTTVAFAISLTLIQLYPKNKVLKYLAVLYAFYIGIGVSDNIKWFSEFAAGAIIGTVIGHVIGKSFRQRLMELSA